MTVDMQALPAALAASPPPLLQTGYLRLKRCRYGLMLYNTLDTFIGRSFDLYGEFAEDEVTVFRQLVRPGQMALDIGANIGAHSLALAAIVGPLGRVMAFEPQRVIFQLLNANIALNGLPGVSTHQMALGNATGHIKVPLLDYSQEGNFGGLSLENNAAGEDVPLLRLDGLELPACHFAKIDVEGMEIEVLKGMGETIRRHRPRLYVENDRPQKSAALIAHLLGLDYRLYFHATPCFTPANFFGNPVNIYGRTGTFNMICLPRELSQAVGNLHEITDPNEKLLPDQR